MPINGDMRRFKRILYCFLRKLLYLGYVQDMNELLLPFLYVFTDSSQIFGDEMDKIEAMFFYWIMRLNY